MCLALSCLFLIFEQRSYCPASKSRTSWPPTPAKTNSGILTCYNSTQIFRRRLLAHHCKPSKVIRKWRPCRFQLSSAIAGVYTNNFPNLNYCDLGYEFNENLRTTILPQDQVISLKTKCFTFIKILLEQLIQRMPSHLSVFREIKLFDPKIILFFTLL
jgi:hypothetical protein